MSPATMPLDTSSMYFIGIRMAHVVAGVAPRIITMIKFQRKATRHIYSLLYYRRRRKSYTNVIR